MTQPELGFIHQFVPAAEPDSPVTLLLLHGTGGNEQDLLLIGNALWPDARYSALGARFSKRNTPFFSPACRRGIRH